MTDQASPFSPFTPLGANGPTTPVTEPTPSAPRKRGPRRTMPATEAAATGEAPKKRGRPSGSGNKNKAPAKAKSVKAAPAPAAHADTGLDPLDALHHISDVLSKVKPAGRAKIMALLGTMFG